MDINQLRIFASVYRNRSFTRASEELNISQPTISEHIKNLERDLECTLFDRLTRKIIPTAEARAIFARASNIIDEMSELQEAVRASKGNITGPVTIGASTIPGTYILPYKVAEFSRDHPQVSFEILIDDSRQIIERILNHEILLGFVGAMMDTNHVNYEPCIDDELILVAPQALSLKKSIPLPEILHLPFIQRELGSGTRTTTEAHLAKAGIALSDLKTVALLGSTASVKEALKAGLGVSILSRMAVQDELERGLLQEIRMQGLKMTRSFYLVTHKSRVLPAPYESFQAYLLGVGPI